MYKIKFHNKYDNLEKIYTVNPDIPCNKIFSDLGLDVNYIFFRNIMRESLKTQWNKLYGHNKYREMFEVSYLLRKEYTIDIIALGNRNENLYFYEKTVDEKQRKLIALFDRFRMPYCIKNLLKNVNFVYNLFYNNNRPDVDVKHITFDEIYYTAFYFMFKIDYERRFFFAREIGKETESCFLKSDDHDDNLIQRCFEEITERLLRDEPDDFRTFFLRGYYHVKKKNKIDTKIAELFFEEAIKRGDYEESLYELYKLYCLDYEMGVEFVESKLNEIHEFGSNLRNFRIINISAFYYYVREDKKKAMDIYKKAISYGSTSALWKSTFHFYAKENINNERVISTYEKIMTYNNPMGYHCMGLYYSKKKEYKLMEKYYLIAIEKYNYTPSLVNLSLYYEKKWIKIDLLEKYITLAICKGSSSAMYNYCYFLDRDDIKNRETLIKFYEKSYMNGSKRAGYELGRFYNKIGNFDLMKKTFIRCIENEKCSSCMNKLGSYYLKNNNEKKALILFKKGSLRNDSDSFYYIGEVHRHNNEYELMVKNYKLCLSHFNLNKHVNAMEKLANYYYDISNLEYFKYYIMGIFNKSEKCLIDLYKIFLDEDDYYNALFLNFPSNYLDLEKKAKKNKEKDSFPLGYLKYFISHKEKIAKKLFFLVKNLEMFRNYDYVRFTVYYYIMKRKKEAIEHLKTYCCESKKDTKEFEEYVNYTRNIFKKSLQKILSNSNMTDVFFNF